MTFSPCHDRFPVVARDESIGATGRRVAADRVFPLLLGSLPRLMAFLDLCVYPAWSSRRQPISNRAASSHA